MPQDVYTLRRVAMELDGLLQGAKVNKINQPLLDEVILHLYNKGQNFKLVISANAVGARVGITTDEKPNPLTAFGFCMLLRKYLLGAEITSVTAVENERIIRIDFSALNDFFESKERSLYAEIMGKYSNIVLTENGKILGSLKAFNLDINSLRPLMAGMTYILPPKQEKFYPNEDALLDKYSGFLSQKNGVLTIDDLTAFIFENIIGFSKQTAKEFAVRFVEKSDFSKESFTRFLQKFLTFSEDGAVVKYSWNNPIDFFAYDYKSVDGEVRRFDSVLSAQEDFYIKKEKSRILGDGKRKILSVVKKVEDKLKKRAQIIAKKEQDALNFEDDKLRGELLLAYAYKIKKGEDFAIVENYYDDMKPLKISLDKNLTVTENAELYFKRYNKQKRTQVALVPQKEELKKEFDYLTALKAEAEIADCLQDYEHIEEELQSAGFIKKVQTKNKKPKKVKFTTYSFDGYQIKVGKNNIQNDELTFSATGNSLWVHAKDMHSAHLIIEFDGRDFSDEVIKFACEICAYYSEGRQSGKVAVDYTRKKFVKKPPKANPGFVTYTSQKTMRAEPIKHDEFIKKQ